MNKEAMNLKDNKEEHMGKSGGRYNYIIISKKKLNKFGLNQCMRAHIWKFSNISYTQQSCA